MNIEIGKKYRVVSSESPGNKNTFIISPSEVLELSSSGNKLLKISHLFLGNWVEVTKDGTILTSWSKGSLMILGEVNGLNGEEMTC